ncbi:FAD dependent oxidoreductase TIGR03364 [Isoptericola variabilis J7]|uniref:FAD dependent oxidoreductase n=1 Tax=Isoptericola variabilis (strain 225) TaxID=743718 RepID=F6FSC0_ISOV2|nr:FAD dependent oxidoreductase [Isoptericola variabilis 225]TWH28156.1 FAD dependent oxidoreductase TIGR03364 [Isoptericola variabilis J7]
MFTVGQILDVRPQSPRPARPAGLPPKADLVVVGAGTVGLAHAAEAAARGQSVVVVERDPRPLGASVRGDGHAAVTTQDGIALACALATRERWLKLGREAGFWVRQTGSVVVARTDAELAVLDDLVAMRDGDAVLLDAAGVQEKAPLACDDVVGGVLLPLDVRLEPRESVPALAAWLAERPGVDVAWSTAVHTLEPGSGCTLARTSRGEIVAKRVVVAVGHDLDRLFPDAVADADVRRAHRQWLRVTAPGAVDAATEALPAVLGGSAMLHHPTFGHSPALVDVRERLRTRSPGVLDAGVHLAFTSRADGSFVVGSARTPDAVAPYRSEAADAALLAEARMLLGADLRVLERWSSSGLEPATPARLGRRAVGLPPGGPFVVAEPLPGVRAVAVLSGLGTTTAHGLAARVLDTLL